MKLGIVSTMSGSPWGGSEELWFRMAEEALNQGHKIVLSCLKWETTPAKIEILKQKGVTVYFRPRPKRTFLARVKRKIFRNPFEELFKEELDSICISQGATYDFLYNLPLVDYLVKYPIPFNVICHYNSEVYNLNETLRKKAIGFLTKAQHVLFVANHNLEACERQLAFKLPNAKVVQNPVNLKDLEIVPYPENTGGPVNFGCVARLEIAFKGQDILFEALSRPFWQDKNWKLRLYGAGPDKDYLQDLAKFYGLTEKIEFIGFAQDIKQVWSENHLLVLPSRGEGTPLALIEAMVCGRPSLVTDVGGNTDWITEPPSGFIAEAATANSIHLALVRGWEQIDNWKEIGRKAHEAALARLDKTPEKTLLNLIISSPNSKPVGK